MKSIQFMFFVIVVVFTTYGQGRQHKTDLSLKQSDSTGYITTIYPNILQSDISKVREGEPWVKQVYPVYPKSAVQNKIEGTVVLKALVGKKGKVKRIVVISSSNSIFNDAAIKALKKWIFEPAMMKGKYVEVWIQVPFNFKLKKE